MHDDRVKQQGCKLSLEESTRGEARGAQGKISNPHGRGIDPSRFPIPEDSQHAKSLLKSLDDRCVTLAQKPSIHPALLSVFAHSPYLSGLIIRYPEDVLDVLHHGPEQGLEKIIQQVQTMADDTDFDHSAVALREYKKRIALMIALADMADYWTLEHVMTALSQFADAVIDKGVRVLIHRAAGDADKARLLLASYTVLAVGKLGGGELNYSSDIDIIALFDESKAQKALKEPAAVFFSRLTRDLVRLFEHRTAEGYVFRVDLRLRPDPLSSALAVSMDGAESYYETVGQNWERAALIKARPVAGSRTLGEAFLQFLRPFIWRRSLDFAAIRDIQSIKRQMDARHCPSDGDDPLHGWNLKLGRGGIREIEFFVQIQQLIYGGHYPELRTSSTCDGLRVLATLDRIDVKTRDRLIRAYQFLRRVEHRVQMEQDHQTHILPSDDDSMKRLARFTGYRSTAGFERALRQHRQAVAEIYRGLFREAEPLGAGGSLVFTGVDDHPETLKTLGDMGFDDPKSMVHAIRRWHHGRDPATRSERARQLLTELTPTLLEAFAETADPGAAFRGFDHFLSQLPAGVELFSLLSARHTLISFLATIMGNAPRLAERLARRPVLLDQVILPGFSDPLPPRSVLEKELHDQLTQGRDFQDRLDIARRWAKDRKFRVSSQLLSHTLDALEVMPTLSNLADVLLHNLYPWVHDAFCRQYGDVADQGLAVIAMGKYGGREMRAASDLDIVMITGSDGHQVTENTDLPPSLYFARLAQRFINALSAHTAEGELYTIDTRLRPLGSGSAITSSLDAFERYHRESAWSVEHMALTRARVVLAPPRLKKSVEDMIRSILCRRRDPEQLAQDLRAIRVRIADEHSSVNPEDDPQALWNVKHRRGGLIDAEFLVQYWQLVHAHDHPAILSTNTLDALGHCHDAGLVEANEAKDLRDAIILWHRLESVLRLCLRSNLTPHEASAGLKDILSKAGHVADFVTLNDRMRHCAARVRSIFDARIAHG